MDKATVSEILEEIGVLLELSGENPFKARTYFNVARALEQVDVPLDVLVKEKRLREIKGVGDALEEKLEELVTTGTLKYHQDLRAKFPETLFELFAIPALGPKRIKQLYDEVGIDSIESLEKAIAGGKLKGLKGFGAKMEEKVAEGIAYAREHKGLFLVSQARKEAETLLSELRNDKSIIRMEVAGSLRRRKEVVKDIDILISSDKPDGLMKRFTEAPNVVRVTGHGETKSSVVLKSGMAADLRVVSDTEFPFALAYFTGSKEHNVVMRQRAKERGLRLNEYALTREDQSTVPCADEAAIYKALDLPYIEPELREDRGEFDAAALPHLVNASDLKGVIHCHSTYSDGKATLAQMADAAKERGFSYFGIADHSQSAAYAGGLLPERVGKQHAEIDTLNAKYTGFRILKGIESDIRTDGSLDYEESVLKSFDYIVASVHSKLDMQDDEATARVIKAIENPYTTILGHPTARLLLARQGYPLHWDKVFAACKANRVALEINANPHRLDIDWRHIRKASDLGCLFSIGPDAHAVDGLDDVHYGIGIARKGWLEKEHILNCLAVEDFLTWKRG
ncbi:MAG: DNA polymerase/3'-5' exonuclease PolX [Candidatus Hydrogenedentota bacterium]